MKNIKKVVAAAMISVMAITASSCTLIRKTPEAIKKTVIATVGDEKITRGDVEGYLSPMIDEFKKQYGENYIDNAEAAQQLEQTKTQIIDTIITNKVLAKKATYDKAEVEKSLDEQIKQFKDQYKDKFEETLKQSGFTEDKLKETLRGKIIKDKVIEAIGKEISIKDEDIKKYYDANRDAQFVTKAGADMWHILVSKDDEAKAKKVKERLDKGEDFKKVSDEVSIDEAAKAQGGSLGFVEYDKENFDKTFLAEAKKLKEGETSAPIKTEFGYHIIRVKNVKATATPKPFDEVKDSIKAYLEQKDRNDKYTSMYEQWKKDLKVEIKTNNLKDIK